VFSLYTAQRVVGKSEQKYVELARDEVRGLEDEVGDEKRDDDQALAQLSSIVTLGFWGVHSWA